MNAPLPEAVRQALARAALDDRYTREHGRVFMSGVQALVRLPMLQRQRDAAAGLDTAGFVSGYRGSPLGTYDQALWAAREHLAAHRIVFQPGLNEELAATAVWGTQQLGFDPAHQKHQGVFGIWYGKGPGVDRCVDVFKHANLAGTAPLGGVLAVAGDDHVAKSSTAAHQSDHVFKACGLPVFFPSSVQEILDLGLHALALSRYAGLWTAMKTIQEVVESASVVEADAQRVRILLPDDVVMPPDGLHIRWPDTPLAQEARLMDHKWYAALAYVRANRLNHTVLQGPHDRIGLIASGKAWNDTRQALRDLGLDDADCLRLGIRLHKVAVVWPLEASTTRDFATGLQEILVIEEKRQVIEYQLKEELYNWRPDVRPNVLGKFDEAEGDHSGGEWSRPDPAAGTLLRANADLSPSLIARAIARRLKHLGVDADTAARMDRRLDEISARERALAAHDAAATGERQPWFCSGCPHNTSTRVPEGSRAMGGIGCHYMAIWMDRRTVAFTQMGGEGVPWVGQAPFSTRPHLFANLGDGTYMHSGLLAIRQSIAAGVNITYKILVNDAVAMTGGQPVEGAMGVPAMTRELQAEGVRRIAIVTDDVGRHTARTGLAPGVTVHPREDLDAVQRELREVAGCSALIYEQTCATELRRRRKRGLAADPAVQVRINERVCEGCGDCATQSNCLSVEPVDTEFGRKRRINPNSCNKDLSCVQGFCPSFVTVEGGRPRAPAPRTPDTGLPPDEALPEPALPALHEADGRPRPWGIVVAGVGGTGVITIGQLLGMAAHLDGRGVVTQDAAGLAQKGGATWSHVQIAARPEAILTTKVDTARTDLLLACDGVVAASRATLALLQPGRSHVVLDLHDTPTARGVLQRDADALTAGLGGLGGLPPGPHRGTATATTAMAAPAPTAGRAHGACQQALTEAVGRERLSAVDAQRLAERLLGDAVHANLLLLGLAWQRGLVPVSLQALQRAIELNGTQVARNLAAFTWGRRAALDLGAVQAAAGLEQVMRLVRRPTLDARIARRTEDLAAYQDTAYARRYAERIGRLRTAEAAACGGRTPVTDAAVDALHQRMAIKDEYEVARLHTDPEFIARLTADFDGPVRLVHHLAPPLLPGRDARGRPRKRRFGPWVRPLLQLLARARGLRGRWCDPFGHTDERRHERLLRDRLETLIDEISDTLQALSTTPGGPQAATVQPLTATALELLRLSQRIRGYGPVREAREAEVQPQWQQAMDRWQHLRAAARRRG
ncbi:MAG: hypothetical protein RL223_3824 [Pseudomonadota bacterium]